MADDSIASRARAQAENDALAIDNGAMDGAETVSVSIWGGRLLAAADERPAPLEALTYVETRSSTSRPVLLTCPGGELYVTKGRQVGWPLNNDQIIGRLGGVMGAPVARTELILVSQGLIDVNHPEMEHMSAGIGHGSLYIPLSNMEIWDEHLQDAANRDAFGLLAIFYGWFRAYDHHVMYEDDPPHRVHSVDHGAFFPNYGGWNPEDLASEPVPEPDGRIQGALRFNLQELQGAAECLAAVTDDDIVRAVATPPDDWGLTHYYRCELVQYLVNRRDLLVSSLLG